MEFVATREPALEKVAAIFNPWLLAPEPPMQPATPLAIGDPNVTVPVVNTATVELIDTP